MTVASRAVRMAVRTTDRTVVLVQEEGQVHTFVIKSLKMKEETILYQFIIFKVKASAIFLQSVHVLLLLNGTSNHTLF